MNRLVANLRGWWTRGARFLGQAILTFLVDAPSTPSMPAPPAEPRYPEGFIFTHDGNMGIVIWECAGCGYQFHFTNAYDPQIVLRNLTVHRLRCQAPLESVRRMEGA